MDRGRATYRAAPSITPVETAKNPETQWTLTLFFFGSFFYVILQITSQ